MFNAVDHSESALSMLQAYDWPGNIRQLGKRGFPGLSVLSEGDLLTEEEFPQISAQVEAERRSRRTPLDGQGGSGRLPRRMASEARSPRPGARPRSGTTEFVKAMDERGNVRSLAEVELEMIKLAIDHYQGPDERGRTPGSASAAPRSTQAQGTWYRP
jgi:DNA-binding NtrC family response regulator